MAMAAVPWVVSPMSYFFPSYLKHDPRLLSNYDYSYNYDNYYNYYISI